MTHGFTRPAAPRCRVVVLWVAALCLAGLALSACGEDGGNDAGTGGDATPATATQVGSGAAPADPTVRAEVAGTADVPIALVLRPGDDQMWLAERAGRIRRVTVTDGGATLTPASDPALDISAETTTDRERGLLGIAFSEDGDTLFVSSTDLDGNTKLARYPVEDDQVDEDASEVMFTVQQPFSNHNGGHILIGPDGALWLGLGDGGSANDPENRAQDPSTPLGKMVRIDVDSGDHEVVASGLRNPWRFSFDTDDSLWISDVGQSAWEEINHLPAGQIDGANLGWSGLEGTHTGVPGDDRTGPDPIDPVFEYSHDGGNCSITGGFVYRGDAIDGLDGAYLFADLCLGEIRAVALDAEGGFAREYALDVVVDQPISFAAGADGEPYVLSASGDIVRLVNAA